MYNHAMKHCSKCKTNKSTTEFYKRGNGLQPWCKLCKKAHDQETYKNKPHRRKALKESTQKYRSIVEAYIIQYLESHPCPCGETNLLKLQFDHLHDKEFEIGLAVMQGYSLERIKPEIEKCQILCANCHSVKSAHQRNSWKLKWLARSGSHRDSTV